MKGATALATLLAATAVTAAHATSVGPFIIFFDSGSAAITLGAAPILDNAAAAFVYMDSSNPGLGRYVIAGNSDSVGPAGSNRHLSCARALAVRAYLIEKGIAPRQLIPVGHGEDQPIVRTADGVAEPQNRYVEIQLMAADQVADATAGATRC